MDKYGFIIEELKLMALKNGATIVSRVVSGSMKFLIPVGSQVRIASCCLKKINIGDLIVYKNKDHNYILHRVIWKYKKDDKYFLRTKGDMNLFCDSEDVDENQVIGKVVGVNRYGKKYIDLTTLKGNLISYYFFILSSVMTIFNLFKIFFIIFNHIKTSDKVVPFFFYNKEILGWYQGNRTVEKYFSSIGNEFAIAEVSNGFGYSEISIRLLRKGVRVDLLDISDIKSFAQDYRGKYDIVILSNLFNSCIQSKKDFCLLLSEIKNKFIAFNGKIIVFEVKTKFKQVSNILKIFQKIRIFSLTGIAKLIDNLGLKIVFKTIDRNYCFWVLNI